MKIRKAKTIDCKVCGEPVHNCSDDAVKVTCWKCVSKSMSTGITYEDEKEIDEEFNNNQ